MTSKLYVRMYMCNKAPKSSCGGVYCVVRLGGEIPKKLFLSLWCCLLCRARLSQHLTWSLLKP